MPHHVVFDHCPTEKICFWAQKGPGYREMHELPKFASEKFLNQHMGAGRYAGAKGEKEEQRG